MNDRLTNLTLMMTLYKHHLYTFGPGKDINTETIYNLQERERERESETTHIRIILYGVILHSKLLSEKSFKCDNLLIVFCGHSYSVAAENA